MALPKITYRLVPIRINITAYFRGCKYIIINLDAIYN